jgi:hypothetical protein
MPYLPTQALWQVGLEGDAARQIAPAELSYMHPDAHPSGALVASRLRMQFDVWNTRRMERRTTTCAVLFA